MAGDAKTKRKPKGEPPPPAGDDEHDDDEHDDDVGDESIEAVVRRVLADELPRILGEENDDDDQDDDDDTPPARSRRSASDDERIAYKAIRGAMEKLSREDHTETRLKQLEQKITEEAPAQVRRATRLMWGNPERAK